MPKIEIVSYSGFGHTDKQAEAVLEGAREAGDARLWQIPDEDEVSDELWEALDNADAIIFGSPTYMGGPAWQFKRFADASSSRWMKQQWKDKVMGGFTNSGAVNGDKSTTLLYFVTLASQHGGIWISLGQLPSSDKDAGPADMNWAGGSVGAMSISPTDADPDEAPRRGGLASARAYGERVARLAAKLR